MSDGEQIQLLIRLDERMKAMDERSKTEMRAMSNKLDTISTQVTKTNGRVTALESWKSELKGGWKATASIGGVIGGVIAFIINHFL